MSRNIFPLWKVSTCGSTVGSIKRFNFPNTRVLFKISVHLFNPIPPSKDTFYHCDSISSDKARGMSLTLFLPALGGISPYMSITWQQLVGIRLNLIIISSLDLKWKAFKAKKALLTPFFGSSFQVKSFQQSVQQLLFDIVAKAKLL